jgi:hypothetical protein
LRKPCGDPATPAARHASRNQFAQLSFFIGVPRSVADWCDRFERRWPRGTRERLAYDVFLYTGLRIGDAVRLGRPHVKNGIATIRTEKNVAFATVAEEHIDAVHIGVDALFGTNRARLIGLAARYHVPTSYPWREFTAEGGLMNYGANIREQVYQVGSYAARILKGEKPADRPVQRPTRLEFVLNLKTARALGIDVQPSLLSLADEVIE